MALNNYRNNPDYPDRYSRNKQWNKILPIQGRPLQAAELTEIQSILQDNIKQGFNSLFNNGGIIEGLRISVVSRTFDTVVLSISKGQLYIEGIIIDVNNTNITVRTDSIYNINVVITESIITEIEDNTLRDPIKGGFVLGTPGAARLVWNTNIAYSKPEEILNNAFAIGQVVNGTILQKDLNPFYEVEKIMSQFIYERSGNFCVSGLETISLGQDKRSSSNINKYNLLKGAVDTAEDNKQNSLSNLVSYQSLVNSLTSQVQNAQIQTSINPTPSNNLTLSSLQKQLSEAQTEFSKYSNELAIYQRSLEAATNSLNNSENLLTDQQIISISPGISYIEGYRVSINSPTKLYIPQALPTTSIESATFTFRGLVSQTLKEFSLTSGTLTEQSTQQYVTLEIYFKNIQVNPNVIPTLPTDTFSISVIYKIQDPTALSTIVETIFNSLTGPTINNNNINYKILDESAVNTPQITEDSFGDLLTQPIIKDILNKYIQTSKPTDTSLLFKATNFTLEASSILIDIKSKIYLKSNDNLISNISNINTGNNIQTLSEPVSNSTYQLEGRPVQKINRLVANLSTTVTITRDENDSVDFLNEDSIVNIQSVTQTVGSITNTFSSANYYNTQSGIGWRLNAPSPASGTAYQVTFTYTEPLIENSDFILNTNTDTIEFIGRTPNINNIFTVDYSYSLSKGGVITLDKDGNFNYLLSSPSKNPTIPAIPTDKLGIASFILSSNKIEIKQLECKRQTVGDLYNLAEKIKQNTLNNQILKADISALNNALAQGDNPIGVYTDPIINLDKIDVKKTTAAIVPGVQAFMSGYSRKESEINYTNISSKIVNSYLNVPEYAILPYTETKFFSQPRATRSREVTNLHPSINKRSRLYSNYKYIFLNTESIEKYPGTTILKSITKLSPCDPISRSGNFFSNINNNSDLIKNIINNVRNILGPYASQIIGSFTNKIPFNITNTSDISDFVAKAFNDYKTKAIQIELYADNLPPNIKGFKVYIDGQKWYNYVLRAGTLSSIGTGTFADAQDGFTVKQDGTVSLAITLPEELPTGTHTIEIKKEGSGYCKTNIYVYNTLVNQLVLSPLRAWNAIPITTSAAEPSDLIPIDYFSEDLNNIGVDPTLDVSSIDNTITYSPTIESAFPTKHNTINQTFVPNEDYFLTRADIKINNAPSGINNKLVVILNETNQQIPIKQIKALTKSPSSYNINNLAFGIQGLYTNFEFELPQFIKKGNKYSLGLESYLGSDNSNFSVYTAVADDLDITTNNIIGSQLFINGDLFTSFDGSSISKEAKEDLTLELYRANFSSTSEVNIGTFSMIGGINFFCYNTLDIIPVGTEVKYEYRVGSSNWIPFNSNTVVCLNIDAASIEIKATLLSNFNTLTPIVLLKGASITMYNSNNTSSIISKQITYPEPYKKITVIIDYIKPANTFIDVFYSPNDGYAYQGVEWKTLNLVNNSTIILDQALQIYRSTYYLEESAYTYINLDQRVKFRYKINLTSTLTGISPLVKNIQTYVEE
jgi:hypothetical protein